MKCPLCGGEVRGPHNIYAPTVYEFNCENCGYIMALEKDGELHVAIKLANSEQI